MAINEISLIIADEILSDYGISIWGYADRVVITDMNKFKKVATQHLEK